MKFNAILAITFILIGIIPVGLIALQTFQGGEQIAIKEYKNQVESVAKVQEERIKYAYETKIEKLKLVSSRTKLRDTLKQYNQDLNENQLTTIKNILVDAEKALEEFESISVLDLNGKVISSTDSTLEGKNYSQEEFFIQGKNTENVFIFPGKKEGYLTIYVSGPMKIEEEKLGVILIESSSDTLTAITSDYTGLGETGETVLAKKDSEGNAIYITPLRFDKDAAFKKTISKENQTIPIILAIEQKEEISAEYIDYRGEQVIASTKYIEKFDLGLVVKIDRKEALSPMNDIQTLIIENLIIILIALIILSFFLSRILTEPIKKITQKINEITKGKIEQSLEKSSIQEIQDLTESLNRILASMKLAILRTGMTKEEIGLGEALEAKKEAEEKFEILYNSSRDAIMILDEKNFISGNPATLKMFGFKTEKEFTSKGPADLSPKYQPDGSLSSEKAAKMIGIAIKKGSNFFEWTHKRITGEEFPATVLLTKMQIRGKTLVQATVRDISKKKK